MSGTVVLCVLNAKYVHASPAPWCLKAGIKAYANELYSKVSIIEATINQQQYDIIERIKEKKPSVIGFSCYLWNIKMTLAICKELKKIFPELIIVLGGPEVSYCAKDVLNNNSQIDYILSGEGEESVPAFLKAVFSCEKPKYLPENIKKTIDGLCGRYEDGSIYESEPCVLSGSVPSPLTSDYDKASHGRITYFETSRGCPYSCAFCLSGRCGKPRYFDTEEIFSDLLRLANSGTQTIKFVDRTFNANYIHANKILKFILEHYGKDIPKGICFHFEIAGDILREETFELLPKMPIGAVQLEIGMQSFCEKTLDAVHRKTNIEVLKNNIKRLVAMKNMHIHIDLIAGLPYENIEVFSQSFNTGYELSAQMLQLGFLKLLYGSAMRNEPESYPCEFDKNPPYEVISTPWISEKEFEMLHFMEDALDRVYNSGRFSLTVNYVISKSNLTPFDFYFGLGQAQKSSNIKGNVTLDDYTSLFQEYCRSLNGIDNDVLRDILVKDRLSTNSTGRLPKCLYKSDERFSKILKFMRENPALSQAKGVRRGIAILYSSKTVCYVDYISSEKNKITGRWKLNEISLEEIFN